ncbi:MAG: alpha/beta fold hydrolase [Deltaproteobacteria bacterium]|nr:alpha/beta fold hydrolase [Deltaproteobacteria bacterium]
MALAQRLQLAVGRAQYRAITSVAVRALGLRARTFEVRGVRMPALVRHRDGAPLVLVHGFGTDKEGWLITAARLARGRGLVIPDLPGFGGAGDIGPARATAAAQAAALVGLLDVLGLGRVHLAGSSMGGGVVMRVASDFPGRVASLTLIGSVGPIIEPSEVVTAIGRGENPLVLSGPDDWDRFMALVAERPPRMTQAMARFMAHEKALRSLAHEELLRAWVAAGDDGPPEALESIHTPALIIHGARDRVIHVSTAHALAERLPRARLEVLDRVGHAPQAEAPRRLARLIEAHLARH